MAQIVTITNPITGQPVQVDQLDHTAQQIDDAISRALPGGYYDKWVSQLPGQNLLDNSVFVDGCLVDQRGWYVVPPGVPCSGEPSGVTTKYYTVKGTYIYNDVKYALFDVGDSEYNAPFYTCVRGYTGVGYWMDRWTCRVGQTILITDDGIKVPVSNSAGALSQYLSTADYQDVLNLLKGKTVTLSALFADGELIVSTVTLPESISANKNFGTVEKSDGSCSIYLRWYTDGRLIFDVYSFADRTKDYTLKAAFLDLGDHQKHFYQDENGNWQLNALPNYADTLARCQRYCLVIGSDDAYCPVGVGQARTDSNFQLYIPLPVSLRTYPTVTKSGTIWVRNREQVINLTGMYHRHNLSQNCLSLECSGESAFTPGTFYECFASPGGELIISADL